MNVGFYYAANALGRLLGTLLSGLAYLLGGIDAALWVSASFLMANWLLSLTLPPADAATSTGAQSHKDPV